MYRSYINYVITIFSLPPSPRCRGGGGWRGGRICKHYTCLTVIMPVWTEFSQTGTREALDLCRFSFSQTERKCPTLAEARTSFSQTENDFFIFYNSTFDLSIKLFQSCSVFHFIVRSL